MNVSQVIAPGDLMYDNAYFRNGAEALEWCKRGDPKRILDFGCGHGRVMRFLRAEFPDAEITACDLDPDAVEFCSRTFGAIPVLSNPEANIELGTYDLIWSGSLFTHVEHWDGFLKLLRSALEGVLIFTTAGEPVIQAMRKGERIGLTDSGALKLIADYEKTGFGYHDYEGNEGYGLTRTSEDWVRGKLAEHSFRLLEFAQAGWARRQDVYICS